MLAAGASALRADVLGGAGRDRRRLVSGSDHDVSRLLRWRIPVLGGHIRVLSWAC